MIFSLVELILIITIYCISNTNLSNYSGLSKTDAKASVEIILEALTQGIVTGEGVEVRGFGGFYKKHRKARLGINPKTSERTQVGEKYVP